MAYGNLSESNKRLARYGAVSALCVVVAGGAFVLFDRGEKAAPSSPAPRAARAAAPATPAAAQQAASPGDPVVPTDTQSDAVRRHVADARRQAAAGDFAAAEVSLQKADKVIPDLPETAQARSDIAALATPQGQLDAQLTRARTAVDQGDSAAAEKALAEAERLSPQAPEIAALRQALQAAQQKQTRRNDRVTALLAKMHEAIAHHDMTAADSALNEAERLDVGNPSVQRARAELNRAQSADQRTDTKN